LLVSVQSALPVATDHSGNDRTQAGLCVNEQYQGQFSAARDKRITAAAPLTCQAPKIKRKNCPCNAAKSIEPVLQPASADDDTEISRVFFTQSVAGQRRISRACDHVEEKTG